MHPSALQELSAILHLFNVMPAHLIAQLVFQFQTTAQPALHLIFIIIFNAFHLALMGPFKTARYAHLAHRLAINVLAMSYASIASPTTICITKHA